MQLIIVVLTTTISYNIFTMAIIIDFQGVYTTATLTYPKPNPMPSILYKQFLTY